MTVSAFRPLSKDDLAGVLGISIRTVENWVNDGTLPPPAKLGNRVYWHPNIFYAWLDRCLSSDTATPEVPQATPVVPVTKPAKPRGRSQLVVAKTELDKVRNRTQAQLDELMA